MKRWNERTVANRACCLHPAVLVVIPRASAPFAPCTATHLCSTRYYQYSYCTPLCAALYFKGLDDGAVNSDDDISSDEEDAPEAAAGGTDGAPAAGVGAGTGAGTSTGAGVNAGAGAGASAGASSGAGVEGGGAGNGSGGGGQRRGRREREPEPDLEGRSVVHADDTLLLPKGLGMAKGTAAGAGGGGGGGGGGEEALDELLEGDDVSALASRACEAVQVWDDVTHHGCVMGARAERYLIKVLTVQAPVPAGSGASVGREERGARMCSGAVLLCHAFSIKRHDSHLAHTQLFHLIQQS